MYGMREENKNLHSYKHLGHQEIDLDTDSDIIDTDLDIYGCDSRGRTIISYCGGILMCGIVFGILGKIIDILTNPDTDERIGIFVGVFIGCILGGIFGYIAKRENGSTIALRLHFACFNCGIMGAMLGSGFIWHVHNSKYMVPVGFAICALCIVLGLIIACMMELCAKKSLDTFYRVLKGTTITTFVLGNVGTMFGRSFTIINDAANICGTTGALVGIIIGSVYCYLKYKSNKSHQQQFAIYFSL